MTTNHEEITAMTPARRRELAAHLESQLEQLEDLSHFADVHEIREMARAILVEQLRELFEDDPDQRTQRRPRHHPKAG